MSFDGPRLIEEYLPLDDLNAIAAKVKHHPTRYVELVHFWPARRPITTCRAAIFAALVPPPPPPRPEDGSHDLVSLTTDLAAYEPAATTVSAAAAEIRKAHGGRTPKVLDLFAGGGAIPLEAARLGCESHAVDYNPVAHLIELCTLVYPQTFGPKLADDFRQWAQVILHRMRSEVGDLYPDIQVERTDAVERQGALFDASPEAATRAEPVTYVWARTVPCRRPGCGASVPLVRQAWLRKKKDRVVAAVPRIDGSHLRWDVLAGSSAEEVSKHKQQTLSGQAVCPACGTPAPASYVKAMAVSGRMEESLAAVAVALPPEKPGGKRRKKLYLHPGVTCLATDEELEGRLSKLLTELRLSKPTESLQGKLRDQLPAYGVETYEDLFTKRQLLVLFTLVKHIRQAHAEMLEQRMADDRARAITTFFAMTLGRLVVAFSKFSRWEPGDGITAPAIGERQALKMIYDFSEINPFANTKGCLSLALEREEFCIRELAKIKQPCVVSRGNAEKLPYDDETFDAVITDPPYYSSIYYADLSAFFYVWLKRTVGYLYPDHFAFATPPKRHEAVAQPSEHGGDASRAKAHYERVMRNALAEARRVLKPGAPMVCVYAHRTTDGWATLIRALVGAGMTVTEAWPLLTEARGRPNAIDAAALSDSIFFVARRRERAVTGEYETQVEPRLHEIARERVKTLWADGKGIGGADLLMAAVGAGLQAYTQFERVDFANGESVSAEQYLRDVESVVLDVVLNEIFGLSGAQVAAVDRVTRFYILWRFTYREAVIEAGDAYVFCYPQGIEIDGPEGLAGKSPSLVEKVGGKFRVRNYKERGEDKSLGIASSDGGAAALVDVLHRLLYLLEERPAAVGEYLEAAKPNTEQLRLVAQALAAPTLSRQAQSASTTPELGALARLNANWRALVERGAYTSELASLVSRTGDLLDGDQQR